MYNIHNIVLKILNYMFEIKILIIKEIKTFKKIDKIVVLYL